MALYPQGDAVDIAKLVTDLANYKNGVRAKIVADLVGLGIDGAGEYADEIIDIAKLTKKIAGRNAEKLAKAVAEAVEKAISRVRAIGVKSEVEITRIGENAAQAMSKGSKFTESTLSLGGNPKGVYEAVTGDASMIRSITRQNEAADFLAKEGYDIEMLPNKLEGNGFGLTPTSNPDFKINGEIFDCYSPDTSSVRNIWSTVQGKTISQARRIVLNLDDFPGSMDDLAKQFNDWAIDSLDELLIIKNGKIARLVIK